MAVPRPPRVGPTFLYFRAWKRAGGTTTLGSFPGAGGPVAAAAAESAKRTTATMFMTCTPGLGALFMGKGRLLAGTNDSTSIDPSPTGLRMKELFKLALVRVANTVELKNQTNRLLKHAMRGEPVIITYRGKPAASLTALTESDLEDFVLEHSPRVRQLLAEAATDLKAGRVLDLERILRVIDRKALERSLRNLRRP